MAASKAPKKATIKTAATKKAAAKKVKRAPKKTAPEKGIIIDHKLTPRSALRVADEPAEPIIEEPVIQVPPVAYIPGRGGAVRIQPAVSASYTLEAPESTVVTTTEPIPAPIPETIPEPITETTPIPEPAAETIPQPAPKPLPVTPNLTDMEQSKDSELPEPETHKPKILELIKSLWQRVENWKYLKWVKWVLIVLAILYAVDTFFLLKRNYDIKQTKKVEAKVAQKEEQARLTDSSIVEMQRIGDSLRDVSDNEIQKATDHLKASQEANQKRVNLIKLQRYDLDNKIKSLNNNDERRKLGSESAKPK